MKNTTTMADRRRIAVVLAAGTAALWGCSEQAKAPPARPKPAPVAAAPAMSPAMPGALGPARDCVSLAVLRDSNVRSDHVIDFNLADGTILRNRLPQSCPELGFERAFSFETSLTQLCSVDIITVLRQGGGIRRGASCGLGKFVPISKEAARAPLAEGDR